MRMSLFIQHNGVDPGAVGHAFEALRLFLCATALINSLRLARQQRAIARQRLDERAIGFIKTPVAIFKIVEAVAEISRMGIGDADRNRILAVTGIAGIGPMPTTHLVLEKMSRFAPGFPMIERGYEG